jgi:hypothetical protein
LSEAFGGRLIVSHRFHQYPGKSLPELNVMKTAVRAHEIATLLDDMPQEVSCLSLGGTAPRRARIGFR